MSASILVAVDLSHEPESKAVLARAAEIAKLDDAALSVITVVPDYGSSLVGSFFEEGTMKKALAAAQEALKTFVAAALPDHADIRHVIGNGGVYDEVLKAAGSIGADMIVMGAAKPGVGSYLLGPNAARVARHFDGSVLIVR